jgi:PTS system cellobiose-specific IIB component
MRTVLVVCGAGASSTFLALAMRRRAASRGIPMHIEPVGESQLTARLDDADAVLVGPHLAAGFPEISARAARHGVPAALLADAGTGAAGAERALEAGLALLDGFPTGRAGVSPSPSITIPATPHERSSS